MDVKDWASIAGVLGFFISVATFILTRIERRKNVIVEVFKGDYSTFQGFDKEDEANGLESEEIIKIRLTNIGGSPIIVNPESFFVRGNSKEIKVYDTDWLGFEKIPSPLQVGGSVEVAIFLDTLEKMLNLELLNKYANPEEHEKTIVPLEVGFKDHKGRTFKTRTFKYFYYVGEIGRDR